MRKLALTCALAVGGLAGCLLKPDRPAGGTTDASPADASGDGRPTGLVPRLISTAYYARDSNAMSPGMTDKAYQISTHGIVDGDLVLFISSIDTGGFEVWGTPGPGFQQITTQTVDSNYGTTFYAAWKIANNEPSTYGTMYGPGATDGDATIALVAITGFDPTSPINSYSASAPAATYVPSPVPATAPALSTTVPGCLVLWAGGAEWQSLNTNSMTYAPPADYQLLKAFGDRGVDAFDRTSLGIAYATQATAGSTGDVTGMITAANTGIPWGMLIAIAPR